MLPDQSIHNHLFYLMSQNKTETVRSIIKTEIEGKRPKSMRYTFACECGKAYDSYPALYLHFKRSHQIKITTKIQGVSNRVEKRENQRIFTYFYSNYEKQVKRQEEFENCIINQLKLVMEEFQGETGKLYPSLFRLSSVFYEFEEYLNSYCLENSLENSQIIPEIPNFFNKFVLQKEDYLKENKIYNQFCQWMLFFGEWLHYKQYTNYIVLSSSRFDFLY